LGTDTESSKVPKNTKIGVAASRFLDGDVYFDMVIEPCPYDKD